MDVPFWATLSPDLYRASQSLVELERAEYACSGCSCVLNGPLKSNTVAPGGDSAKAFSDPTPSRSVWNRAKWAINLYIAASLYTNPASGPPHPLQHGPDLGGGQHGDHLGQGLQYLPGHDLGVLELGGLKCLLVVPVADLYRSEPGPVED